MCSNRRRINQEKALMPRHCTNELEKTSKGIIGLYFEYPLWRVTFFSNEIAQFGE
jgi:hypothetical protein